MTDCGAKGDGVTDDTQAIRACIAQAQTAGAGSTVYFPAGHYMAGYCGCPASLQVRGTTPIVLQGADAPSVTITETVSTLNLLSVAASGSTVEGLTLDTQTDNALTALITSGSNLSIHDDTLLGGSQTWDVMLAGPAGFGGGQPRPLATGNTVADVTAVNHNADDGFVLEDQSGVTVTNLSLTGSRLSIFFDNGVQVNGYTFQPLPLAANVDGWEIFGPSSNVTLQNVTSYGAGGVIQPRGADPASTISIVNERLMNSGYLIHIGDVSGLTVSGCDLGSGGSLVFNPVKSATGVVVSNATSLPMIRFKHLPQAHVSAAFDGDAFTLPNPNDGHAETFVTTQAGVTNFTVTGGTWTNQAGGFFLAKGGSSSTTYHVSQLTGYPG